MSEPTIRLLPYRELAAEPALEASLDAIFFEASATQTFAGAQQRAAFRERWLGRYLTHYPEHALLAVAGAGGLAGYLVGCLDDPATSERFADIAYFRDFASATRRFPAHLHLNLAPAFRSRGIGGRLLEAFIGHAAAARSPGVHVVTAKGMRNVRFYERNGFAPIAEAASDKTTVVLLGRRLEH